MPLTDPRYGKLQRCPNNPVEADHAMLERLRRFGNLDMYRDLSFDNFSTKLTGWGYSERAVDSLKRAKQQALKFADNSPPWLVLEGANGTGKTHLAVAIANRRLQQFGEQPFFTTAPDLLDYLRRSFNSSEESNFDDYFELVKSVPLLVLDDLGVENPSNWAQEKLFQLLNHRHAARMPTVITTNVRLNDMEPRLSSRIMQRDVVKHLTIDAPDYRRTVSEEQRADSLSLYKHMRFDSFQCESAFRKESDNLRGALKRARNWAGAPEGWLCLLGGYGCGKTHLAAAIAKDLDERGLEVTFVTVPDLLDYLREAFDPRVKVRFSQRFRDIQHCPILILDDLRLASASAWAKEKLFQIIDHRYLSRLPTVITTAENMDEIDARLATRLMDRRLCLPFAIDTRSYVKRQSAPR